MYEDKKIDWELPKCCRFCAQNSTFSVLRQAQNSPFFLLAFLLALSLRAPKSKKNIAPTMADTNSPTPQQQ